MQHTKHLRLEENRRRFKFKLEGLSGAKKLQLFMMQRLALFQCVVTLCYSKKFQKLLSLPDNRVCGGGCLVCVCVVFFFLGGGCFCFFVPHPPLQEASVSELPLRR